MRDVAYKTSSTNPSFIERLNNAIAMDKAQKDLEVGIGPAFDNWKPVLEANQQKTLQEMKVKGYTQAHSELIERVSAASEMPAMTFDEKGKYWAGVVEAQKKTEEALEKSRVRGWQTKEERLEKLQGQLEDDLLY